MSVLVMKHNSRQIPSDKSIVGNKQYYDLLFGYLQTESLYDKDEKMPYLEKRQVNYTKLAAELKISRQTASKYVKHLLDCDIMVYDEYRKRYWLPPIDRQLAVLLPVNTVRVICNTLHPRCLSILAYLLKTYVQHNNETCDINMEVIKDYVGLNPKNRGVNSEIIRDCMFVLKKLELIDYKVEKRVENNTTKTYYVLLWVNNEVDLAA